MKKRKLLLAAAAFSVFLAGGCQSHGEEAQPIKAMYIEKGEDFQIFVDTSTGVLFDASIPEGTEELTTGDLVEIYGDGIMLESYPGQYPGVSRIVVTKQGSEEDAKQYESLVDEVYQEPDPSEPPYLNLEYRTKEALVSAVADRGSYTWRYTDEHGEEKEIAVECGIRTSEKWGFRAGALDTGVPPSIVAQMIYNGEITERGAFGAEMCVPPIPYFKELAKRQMPVYCVEKTPLSSSDFTQLKREMYKPK